MRLNFIDPTVRQLKPAARVHVSGKLGFNSDAAKFMNLEELPSYVVATSDSEEGKYQIFFIDSEISKEMESPPPPITVAKAGKYFYVQFINILNQLEIEFLNQKIVFDIVKQEYEGFEMFVLTRREQKEDLRTDHQGQRDE